MSITCFLATKLNLAQRSLRRYAGGSTCPGPMGYHDASVVIVASEPFESEWEGTVGNHPRADPHWPVVCDCGYTFADDDTWQCNLRRLYEHPGTGERFTLREAPAGAMHFTDWHKTPHLVVRTPGGDWDVDGPATNGPGWTRVGEPPAVTAQPSIHIPGKYHGWLRDGLLVEC